LTNSFRYPRTPDIDTREEAQPSDWRKKDPLFKKYGHLSALASFQVHTAIDESGYPGEYMIPDHANTHMRGIQQAVAGHFFEVTETSQFYYHPPGAYASDFLGRKINVADHGDLQDRVFGVGVEFKMELIRGAVMWDDDTHTFV
jgi:hypothetical protein